MTLSTPIAFIIFNRPDLAAQTFAKIAQTKPQTLLVIADGPRSPQEAEICEKTRAIIKQVDWDCHLLMNFSDQNLGCGRRLSSGLTWVFSQVEEAIILEDDTLPTPSFFSFCQTLLERYRDDERVMHINGDNSLMQTRNRYSYFFSKYMHCWGWASWRRAWQYYDYTMQSWPEFKQSGMFALACEDIYEQRFWAEIWDQMHQDPQIRDTWDYQWAYACLAQGGLTITPNCNLISNIGFNRADSSHAKGDNPRSKLPTTDLWEIHHPPFVIRDRAADAYTFDHIFYGKQLKAMDTPIGKLRQTLSPLKKKLLS